MKSPVSFGRHTAAYAAACLAVLLATSHPAEASGRDEVSRDVQKSFPWKPGQRLDLEHTNGDVRIHSHAVPEIVVHARIRVSASDMEEAKKFSDAIVVEMEGSGAGVTVRTRYPEKGRSLFSFRQVSFAVDYEIAVPEAAGVSIRNRFGDVSAVGLKGGSDIHNGNGKVSFRDGRGPLRLENSFGSLEVAGQQGDAEVSNQNGTVQIADVDGQLSLRNRFGRVTVVRVKRFEFTGNNADVSLTTSGPASVTTSFGAVEASGIAGDLRVQNNNGPVTARGVAGQAELATGYAALSFEDVKKSVRCSGTNARVTGRKIGENVEVVNTFGPVELSDIGGMADVQNTNAAVRLREVRGKADVRNRFGDVDCAGMGGDLSVANQNGAVTLSNIEGGVDVRNSFGAVKVTRAKRGAKVQSGNGAVSISDCPSAYVRTSFGLVETSRITGDVTIENQNGAVRVGDVRGAANVRTSFASAVLEGVGGSVDVDNQNGSVEVHELVPPTKGCNRLSVKTSFAPIRISLPESVGYVVTARTSFGKISTEMPFTTSGAVGGDSLFGKIGDGRCEVLLTNSNGNIDLVKQARK